MSPPAPVFLRRRFGIESMAGKGGNSTTPLLKRCRPHLGINGILPDDILVLILCCLPCQSAVTCKLVCKHWLCLISTPGFISCSISRQIQQQHDDADEKYDPMILKTSGRYLFLTSSQLLINPDISFTFLPCTIVSALDKKIERQKRAADGFSCFSTSENMFEIRILASFDDLFLCTEWSGFRTPIFICNPFTKEWFELPPTPPSKAFPYSIFGFIHKPYYHRVEEGSEQRVLVSSSCSFRVVQLKLITNMESPDRLRSASEFEVDIFSSETWQWTTSMMQHSSRPNKPQSSISRNGLLYWLCSHGQVIIHDPYNNKVRCVAPPPQDDLPRYDFSVSQGFLLAYHKSSNVVSVWKLEDEDCDGHQQPKWRFAMRSVELNYSEMKDIVVHPNDRNIIYFWSRSGRINTLSLRTGKFKRSFVQELVAMVNRKSYEVRRFKVALKKMVVLKAPCWPTPICALLKSAVLRGASSKLKNELKRLQWNANN